MVEIQKVKSDRFHGRRRLCYRFTFKRFLKYPVFVSALLLACLVPGTLSNRPVRAAGNQPLLISQETSTRAIALESLCLTSEPFALTSPCSWGSDRQTRVILFAMDLQLQPGENSAVVTADAEDATHRHYDLMVEYVAPVPQQEWLSEVVLKLNDQLGDVGDVLVQISYRGVSSNRVRLGIGHVGGGPADDQGATPTPVRPFTLAGEVQDDDNQALEGIEVTLTDITDGTRRTSITGNGGSFAFGVSPSHSVIVIPTTTSIFNFSAQSVAAISNDQALDFHAVRRTYSIGGTLTGSLGDGKVADAIINLSGSPARTTTSDSNGNFRFTGIPAGRDYAITIDSTPYYNFSAQSLTLGADQIVNFTGALRFYTIAGKCLDCPAASAGLVISIGGSQTLTVTTDADGKFSSSLPAGGSYTITPAARYYAFSPLSEVLTDLTSDLNLLFIGTRQGYRISGKLIDESGSGLPGMTVHLTGVILNGPVTTTTDQSGHYEFGDLPAANDFTVTPESTAAYVFKAENFFDLDRDQTFDFMGLRRLTLSGKVRDQSGDGIFGISVSLSGSESGVTTTAADGSYSLTATARGNYTVTPSIPQGWYTFAPSTSQFNNLAGAQSADFTATLGPVPDPADVLEFDGSPKTVDYGAFWPENVDLGHFFWEFWAMPGDDAGATYMLSDGYGGAHALLFGVADFNTSEPGRYELFGNIFDGVKHDNNFGSDQGPAIGEWGHFAVGWDGQNIITYFDGVPVGKAPFHGPRRTPGPAGGGGRLLIGGSDHNNWRGRIAQVRGYEGFNPREGSTGSVEASFAPQTVFSVGGNLLSYYFRSSPRLIADLSLGYGGVSHQGFLRGTTTGIIFYCETCPPPKFVVDPTAPNFANGTPSPQSTTSSPPVPPNGALVFDSFSRANSTYIFGGHGGLGSTEGGTAGTQAWQTDRAPASSQPFGILNSIAVLLGNDAALAWVPTGSSTGNIDVRVDRSRGRWGRGIHTGLSFRVLDAENFFFAYTSDADGTSGGQILRVGYYQNGNRVDLQTGAPMPPNWTTLRVITTNNGGLNIYADATLVYSTTSLLMRAASGAGLYNNTSGLGLVNRWDNFTVFNAP
jgi:hypothetical protein